MTGARTILHNTTVVDVRDGSARRGVDITIDGGRISSIAPSGDDHPGGVAVMDARGIYAVPGFCDMHARRSRPSPRRTRPSDGAESVNWHNPESYGET
jgi:adenine deaminase